ncbi:GGDEF domain-containing protein [Lysobacter sp. N42]|nr:GGDEF domain-containing protein [Lysobacter sp. N42]
MVLSGFGLLRFAAGQDAIGAIDLGWALAFVAALAWRRVRGDSTAVGMFMAAVSMACSLARIHLLGASGIPWLFPIILGTFAVTAPRPASVIAGTGVAYASILLFAGADRETAASASISLVLTFMVARVTTTHVESLRLRLEGLASRDPLTGAGNRRGLDEALLPLLAADAGESAVALMDLDHFKVVNDRHGHATGDRVLVEFAALVRRLTRPQDRLFRYGGEEFVLVMPATSEQEARDVAERLGRAVRETIRVRHSPVTVSIGVALARSGEAVATLLGRADEALYAAKSGGRDRVVMA